MTPENFVYWLQGYLELNDAINKGVRPTDVPTRSTAMPALEYITPSQIQVIKDRLKLVLEKKTPTHVISIPSMSGKNSETPPDLVDKLSQILHSNSGGGDISFYGNC